tara:strand:+ start:51032 stop:51334 length:303 start_codon:yes stop_codon:yes gene_type:complete
MSGPLQRERLPQLKSIQLQVFSGYSLENAFCPCPETAGAIVMEHCAMWRKGSSGAGLFHAGHAKWAKANVSQTLANRAFSTMTGNIWPNPKCQRAVSFNR